MMSHRRGESPLGPMGDKVSLLMAETGCDHGEAELALQLCGYDVQSAVQAIPRLFQNIGIFKGRFRSRSESVYGLWLVILNLREKRLLRVRAVASFNPAVYANELQTHWFDFEARLYACRLWPGTVQHLSQEIEGLLAEYFDSPQGRKFYDEEQFGAADAADIEKVLARRFSADAELELRQDVLDMEQFQDVLPRKESDPAEQKRPKRLRAQASTAAGPLILAVTIELDPEGTPSGELSSGDMLSVSINDPRDIGQYLARLLGGRDGERSAPLVVPIEAVETNGTEVSIRVRFSAGVCGDANLPADLRVKVSRKPAPQTWWKKFFGG